MRPSRAFTPKTHLTVALRKFFCVEMTQISIAGYSFDQATFSLTTGFFVAISCVLLGTLMFYAAWAQSRLPPLKMHPPLEDPLFAWPELDAEIQRIRDQHYFRVHGRLPPRPRVPPAQKPTAVRKRRRSLERGLSKQGSSEKFLVPPEFAI